MWLDRLKVEALSDELIARCRQCSSYCPPTTIRPSLYLSSSQPQYRIATPRGAASNQSQSPKKPHPRLSQPRREKPTSDVLIMAEITEASLRETITERLKAVHVEVTDMSGQSFFIPPSCHPCHQSMYVSWTSTDPCRRLWSSLHNSHRLTPISRAELAQAPPPRECRPEG